MRRACGWLVFGFVAACGASERAKPTAPVTVDVQPVAAAGSVELPPPDAAKYITPEPAPSSSTSADEAVAPATGPFDRGAAARALGNADYRPCATGNLPSTTTPGHVTVTFDPSGRVSSAVVDSPPWAGTAVGGCVAHVFASVRVPPFAGAPVRVGKMFTFP